MAARLHADLCATLAEAEASLAQRGALPRVGVAALDDLAALAARLERGERLAARTLARATVEVGHRLAGGSGLAVHPTTVRDRAESVAAARDALAEAEAALSELMDGVADEPLDQPFAPPVDQSLAPPVEGGEPEPDAHLAGGRLAHPQPSSQTRRSRAIGAVVGGFGLALILLGLGVLELWAALILPLIASLWASRYLGGPTESPIDDEVSENLAKVLASTDEVFGARRAGQEAADRLLLARVTRDRAAEDLRVAEHAWHDLAGADAEIEDLDAVVARFDPQHEDAQALAGETPGVRAVEAVLSRFRDDWARAWSDLGMPVPDDGERAAAVAALAERARRAVVLVGPATARGHDIARAAPAAVVVELHGPVLHAAEDR
jgi:hypothetical protein